MNKLARWKGRLLLLASIGLLAQHAMAVDLTGISTKKLASGEFVVSLKSSAPIQAPKSFTTKDPERLIVDLPAAKVAMKERKLDINDAGVNTILVLESKTRTRLVFNLKQAMPSHLEANQDGLDIVFAKDTAPTVKHTTVLSSNLHAQTERATKFKQSATINHIDFRRNNDLDAGKVILELSNPKTTVDINRRGAKVQVKLLNAKLPKTMASKLDVVDFATPVQFITLKQVGQNIEVEIESKGDYEHMVYQADRVLTIEVQSFTEEQRQLQRQQEKEFDGKRLSLNFQDIEVRAVLRLIADFTQLNMVASDSVRGKVTLRLENVPWDQALDIILRSKGLGMRQTGNVIMIAPANELAARERLELEANKEVSALSPLRSEFMQINFAKAADVAALLKGEGNSLLSSRGNVSIDARTNTLLVQDTSTKLDEVREIIAKIDTPVRQVEIEARIVTAKKEFAKSLGVRWGSSAQARVGNVRMGGAGNLGDANATAGGTAGSPSVEDRLNVDFGIIGGGNLAFSLARLGKVPFLDLELSAAATEELTHVVASPKLITANQKRATIRQGRQIPYLEATSSGATSVAFKDATLELNVTPQITPDDHIIMDLNVKQDVVASSAETFNSNTLPVIDTKEIITQVLVNNGETVVLGGIYERTENNTKRKVPFFGDLPLVSFLFKTTTDEDSRNELLIFVTPRIAEERAG